MSDLINDYDSERYAMQIDVFKEIGNIGAGNAVTALASMTGRKIDMSVPDVEIVPFNEIVNILNGPETLVVGALVDLTGDIEGFILLILGLQDAYEMASVVLSDGRMIPEDFTPVDFSELEFSAITEIANILSGSYLSAISSLTGLSIVPSVPNIAMDMVGALISVVAIEYGKIGDSVLFMKTEFADSQKNLAGNFFLIPNYESYKILMKSLGLDV